MKIHLINKIFSTSFSQKSDRTASYDLIENTIEKNRSGKDIDPNKTEIELTARFSNMANEELAFLLLHSGYIPDTYEADSSEETLYSKGIEILVAEWAKRIGFNKSSTVRQKSSIEDVSIKDEEGHLIVCDAKSFRLGRSQKAPNVKDALKEGDILKWLSAHENVTPLGGLVTFPSLHDWGDGSDFYIYLTKSENPISMLFYNHMSYILISGIKSDKIVDWYRNHSTHFPQTLTKKGSRNKYHEVLERELLISINPTWSDFQEAYREIMTEFIEYKVELLRSSVKASAEKIADEVKNISDIDSLKMQLIQSKTKEANSKILSQIVNIEKFRKLN